MKYSNAGIMLAYVGNLAQHAYGVPLEAAPYYKHGGKFMTGGKSVIQGAPLEFHLDVVIPFLNFGHKLKDGFRHFLNPGGRRLANSPKDIFAPFVDATGHPINYSLPAILSNYSTGRPKVLPWSGDYLAAALDSANRRWGGPNTISPVAKYAQAFGMNATELENAVSANRGIKRFSQGKAACSIQNTTCGPFENATTICALTDNVKGVCIPEWYGICDAWALASIIEKEPPCHVNYNNVEFRINDMKALLIYAYTAQDVPYFSAGVRCCDEGIDEYARDKYGRPAAASVRDLDAASMFLLLVNMMGGLGLGMAMDRTAGAPVWNQPIAGYTISTVFYVDPQEVAKVLYKVEAYPFNDAAINMAYIELEVSWVDESLSDEVTTREENYDSYLRVSTYTFVLELDQNLHILGGEYVNTVDQEHMDVIWMPYVKMIQDAVTPEGIRYANVKKVINAAFKTCAS